MYRIMKKSGELVGLTESPIWIYKNKNGCYVSCERSKADGVVCLGTPYSLFRKNLDDLEEVLVLEVDAGSTLVSKTDYEIQLAETDEIAISLYETTLMQDIINNEQDLAIIEIYEAMGGMNNG